MSRERLLTWLYVHIFRRWNMNMNHSSLQGASDGQTTSIPKKVKVYYVDPRDSPQPPLLLPCRDWLAGSGRVVTSYLGRG